MTRSENTPEDQRPVLFLITQPFVVRDYTSSPLFEQLADTCARYGSRVVYSCLEPPIADSVRARGGDFVPVAQPTKGLEHFIYRVQRQFLFRSQAYRFNEVSGFETQARVREITRKYMKSGHPALRPHDVSPSYLGFPLPRSKAMLRLTGQAMASALFNRSRELGRQMKQSRPRLLVICGIQNPLAFLYARYARSHRVPTIGIVGSWDHLTKDGPLPKGLSECWVWNEQMAEEAVRYHEVDPTGIRVTGGIQFDKYLVAPSEMDNAELDESLGLDSTNKTITFAANPNPRGWGEPTIVEHLAEALESGRLGDRETQLVVRSHPFDVDFEGRFGHLRARPNVRLWASPHVKFSSPETLDRDGRLMNALLKRSDLLICGQGTPVIDAACADIPVINVAFDGTAEAPPELGVRFRYEVTHYRKIMTARGSTMVESFDELDSAVCCYRQNPAVQAEGRNRIRREFAGVEDGRLARERVVEGLEAVLSGIA